MNDFGVLGALSGTLANVAGVLLGGALGLWLGARLGPQMQRTLLQALGLLTLYIGLSMAASLGSVGFGPVPGILVALVALALGGVLGEALRLEERLAALGEAVRQRLRGQGRFTDGFVAASLLFCVGAMTVLGGLQNGLAGDPTTYLLKTGLDTVAALTLAGVYGVGVLFSALSVLVVQGSLSLGAYAVAGVLAGPDLADLATHPLMHLLTGVGGLTIVGIAVNLLLLGLEVEGRRIRVAAFLPALALGPGLGWVLMRLWPG